MEAEAAKYIAKGLATLSQCLDQVLERDTL